MHLLIRAAHVVDAASPFAGQVTDVLVQDGRIGQMGPDLPAGEGVRVIEAPNLHVSPGWVDMRASAGDPGNEHREDIASLCRAAAAGGFTDVALLPNTQPAVDDKGTLGYVRRAAEGQPARVHVVAAITKGAAGQDFADMLDLHEAGAVAFSDGHHPLQNPDLLVKTLQYLQPVGALLMNHPEDVRLTRYGQMHEGIQSTLLGLRGIPALAEELHVERDLRLLAYVLTGGSKEEGGPNVVTVPALHFSTLSSARSVELIRQAKAQGLPVSCDVAAHQLVFDDSALAGFDTNLKVNPPFRSPDDRAALWAGLADGTVDAIVSDHTPVDAETKNVEFDQAEFGMTGLETAFAAVLSHNPGLPLARIIATFTTGPRQVLRLPPARVAVGEPAVLTLFNPAGSWTYEQPVSKSKNSPFLGQVLTGRVVGTVCGEQYHPAR